MPCFEVFDQQDQGYRLQVLPSGSPIMSVEAACTQGWERVRQTRVFCILCLDLADISCLVIVFACSIRNQSVRDKCALWRVSLFSVYFLFGLFWESMRNHYWYIGDSVFKKTRNGPRRYCTEGVQDHWILQRSMPWCLLSRSHLLKLFSFWYSSMSSLQVLLSFHGLRSREWPV